MNAKDILIVVQCIIFREGCILDKGRKSKKISLHAFPNSAKNDVISHYTTNGISSTVGFKGHDPEIPNQKRVLLIRGLENLSMQISGPYVFLGHELIVYYYLQNMLIPS